MGDDVISYRGESSAEEHGDQGGDATEFESRGFQDDWQGYWHAVYERDEYGNVREIDYECEDADETVEYQSDDETSGSSGYGNEEDVYEGTEYEFYDTTDIGNEEEIFESTEYDYDGNVYDRAEFGLDEQGIYGSGQDEAGEFDNAE